jgi:hypothetical protein
VTHPAHTLTLESCLQICETMNVCCLSCLGRGAVSWQPERCNVWEAKISLGLHRSWGVWRWGRMLQRRGSHVRKPRDPQGTLLWQVRGNIVGIYQATVATQ